LKSSSCAYKPSETQIQQAIVEWASHKEYERRYEDDYRANFVGDFLIAIPNGGWRNKKEASRLKREGVKKGVSDLFLAIPIARLNKRGVIYTESGFWLEIKTSKGRMSKEQERWKILMNSRGYRVACIRSVDEGILIIEDYLGIKKDGKV